MIVNYLDARLMKNHFSKDGASVLEIGWRATFGVAPIYKVQQFIMSDAIRWRRVYLTKTKFEMVVGALILASRTPSMVINADRSALGIHLTTDRTWPEANKGLFYRSFEALFWIYQMP